MQTLGEEGQQLIHLLFVPRSGEEMNAWIKVPPSAGRGGTAPPSQLDTLAQGSPQCPSSPAFPSRPLKMPLTGRRRGVRPLRQQSMDWRHTSLH